MKRAPWIAPLLLGSLLACSAAPAVAGLLDGLFGSSTGSGARAEPGRRTWTIHEFTTIRLVPRESGSAPNQHPAVIDAEVLRQQLARVRFDVRADVTEALFDTTELAELVEPLAQALASAAPEDDLLLLSSSRRGGGIFVQPMGVTARLFVQGGSLQVIVNDARYEFKNNYSGSRVPPTFTYGSRNRTAGVALRSASAKAQRADWLALPLVATAAPAPAATVLPAAAAPAVPAPAAAAAPPLRPRDPGFADEVEQRLTTLKRLRERGLITEEEYQQKRKEILQQL
jgi:hypothetical protein